MNFVSEHYIWFKAIHYIAFVCWMAGVFYLPRLFVYHVENINNLDFVKVVKLQERRLFYGIQTPAMIFTVATGVLMIMGNNNSLLSLGYFHFKLLFAVLLFFYHFDNQRYLKQLQQDKCTKSGKFFRFYNEVPTIILIGIILSFAIAGAL